MRFYCMGDRVKQEHFGVFWKPGVSNLGDYFTKHHSPSHQKGTGPVYLHCPNIRKASEMVCYSK